MEGSPGWTARSPWRWALPEAYITGAFEKDPTVTGNLGTTPLSLTSILTIRPEHTQRYNPPLHPYLHTCTHSIPTRFSPTTHT